MRTWVAAALGLACGLHAPPSNAQEARPSAPSDDHVAVVDQRIAPGFQVEIGCSETQLRTPVATVTWKPPARPPGREQADELRIDVAASKRGFARGHFVKLVLGPAPRVEPSAALQREGQDTLGRTLALEIEGGGREAAETRGGVARVRVKNLEPGVVYFWRLAERAGREWAGGPTVRVQVPACVADIVEEKR